VCKREGEICEEYDGCQYLEENIDFKSIIFNLLRTNPYKQNNCKLVTDLPGGLVVHMDLVKSGLEALENEAMDGFQIESLRLMSNKIQEVGEETFR
jgi:hypothetical protein